MSKWERMTDEELRTEANQRFKNGRYKKSALYAQMELWERHHWDVHDADLISDEFIDQSIEDVQYNG